MSQSTDWQTRQIRITVFLRSPLEKEHRPTLEGAFGSEPEATLTEGPSKNVTELVSFGVGKLTLKVQQERVDWVWDTEVREGELGTLGDPEGSIDAVLSPILTWLQKASIEMPRVALGGIWGIPAESHEHGYQILKDRLKSVQIDPQNSSEFFYRINRWDFSDLRGQNERFNRISSWMVRAVNLFQLSGEPSGGISAVSAKTIFDVTCELDLSSPASLEKVFDAAVAASILARLRGYALSILESGDHA